MLELANWGDNNSIIWVSKDPVGFGIDPDSFIESISNERVKKDACRIIASFYLRRNPEKGRKFALKLLSLGSFLLAHHCHSPEAVTTLDALDPNEYGIEEVAIAIVLYREQGVYSRAWARRGLELYMKDVPGCLCAGLLKDITRSWPIFPEMEQLIFSHLMKFGIGGLTKVGLGNLFTMADRCGWDDWIITVGIRLMELGDDRILGWRGIRSKIFGDDLEIINGAFFDRLVRVSSAERVYRGLSHNFSCFTYEQRKTLSKTAAEKGSDDAKWSAVSGILHSDPEEALRIAPTNIPDVFAGESVLQLYLKLAWPTYDESLVTKMCAWISHPIGKAPEGVVKALREALLEKEKK